MTVVAAIGLSLVVWRWRKRPIAAPFPATVEPAPLPDDEDLED